MRCLWEKGYSIVKSQVAFRGYQISLGVSVGQKQIHSFFFWGGLMLVGSVKSGLRDACEKEP